MTWVVVGGVVFVLVVAVVLLATRKKEEGPAAYAARMGLGYHDGVVQGMIQGFTVRVEARAADRPRAVSQTVYRVQFPQRLNMGLQVAPLAGRARSNRMLETGDQAFDRAVGVEAGDEAKAAALLDEERRACILQLVETYPGAWIDDEGLRWATEEAIGDYPAFKRIVDDLLDCAVVVFPGRAARRAVRTAQRARSSQ